MSTPSADALREEARVNFAAGQAYMANLVSGAADFTKVSFYGITDSGAALLDVTARATETADVSLLTTLVKGAAASLTTVGFMRIDLVDEGGVLTDGAYYIPFGTLA